MERLDLVFARVRQAHWTHITMTKRKNLLRRRLIARNNKPREYGQQKQQTTKQNHSGRQQRGRYCPGKTTIGNEVSKTQAKLRVSTRGMHTWNKNKPQCIFIVIANMCTHPAAHGGLTRVRATRGADAPALRAAGKIRKRDKGHQLVPVSNPVRNACSHTHQPAHWSRQYALATAAVSAMP